MDRKDVVIPAGDLEKQRDFTRRAAGHLARLGRDLDRTLQYWYLLRDFNVSVHTVNSGEVDLSVAAMLRKIIEQ